MPKTYSDEERAYIKKRLKEEAAYCLATYGIRRTTVDMLVERVKIPKGTFYLLYDSKEILLFEVMVEQHELIEKQILDEVASLRGGVTVDGLTEMLYRFYKSIDEIGVFRLIGTGEVELLYRKLPQEIINDHFTHDTDMVGALMETLSLAPEIKADYFSAAFRNLFISTVYKREMGEEYFDEALRLSIRGLVIQMLS